MNERSGRGAPPWVALVALTAGAIYLQWRLVSTADGVDPRLFWPLFVAETFGWVRLVVRTRLVWTLTSSSRPVVTTQRSVDVIVTVFAEPLDVVRATLVGCRSIEHPHQTWIIDEGHREEIRHLAQELDARYVARSQTTGARTGAINHVLTNSSAELLLILDADQVPMPDILDATAGYFDQPEVALVQTPLEYANRDSLLHSDHARHERSHTNEILSPARDHLGAALWEGPAALIRREAMLDIGGIPTQSSTGELQATVRLHASGWTTRYHPEVVVQGSAPHNLDAFLTQRARWARGHVAILFSRDNPLVKPGLTSRQRLAHVDLLAEYLAAIFHLVIGGVIIAALVSGQLPFGTGVLRFSIMAGIWLSLSSLARISLSRGRVRFRETAVHGAVTFQIHLIAILTAVTHTDRRFKPVPATGVDRGGYDAITRLPLLAAFTFLLEAAIAARLLDALIGWPLPNKVGGATLVFMASVGTGALYFLLQVLAVFVHRRQLRSDFRRNVELGALAEGRRVKITDLSLTGMAFVSPTMYRNGETVDLRVRLQQANGTVRDVELLTMVRSSMPNQYRTRWRVGAQLVDPSAETRDALIQYVSIVHPFQQLRAAHPGLNAPTTAHKPGSD